MQTRIQDNKGRDIIILSDNGKIAVSRFPDLSEEEKDYIVELYLQPPFTGKDEEEIRAFLNYENDLFCS